MYSRLFEPVVGLRPSRFAFNGTLAALVPRCSEMMGGSVSRTITVRFLVSHSVLPDESCAWYVMTYLPASQLTLPVASWHLYMRMYVPVTCGALLWLPKVLWHEPAAFHGELWPESSCSQPRRARSVQS